MFKKICVGVGMVLLVGCVSPNLGNRLKDSYTIIDSTGGAEDPEFNSQLLATIVEIEGITPEQIVAIASGMQFTSIQIKGSYPPGTEAKDRASALYDWLNSRMVINMNKELSTIVTAEAAVDKVEIQATMVQNITSQAISGILNLLGDIAPQLLAESTPTMEALADKPKELLVYLKDLLKGLQYP